MSISTKKTVCTVAIAIGLVVFTLACRAVQNLPALQPGRTATSGTGDLTTKVATTPTLEAAEGWQFTATALVYPGPEGTLPQPPSEIAPVTASPSEESPFGPSPEALTATALLYPGPEGILPTFSLPTIDPNVATFSPDIYPLPDVTQELVPTLTIFPTAVFLPTNTPGPDMPLSTFPAYPFGELQTPTVEFAETPLALPETPTVTSSPTLFVFLTPTPSTTPTPTATATPLPLPPWLAANIVATDPATFRLASGKVQFVEFFAYWSGICLAMAPTVHNLQNLYGSQVNFVFLDIDNPAVKPFQNALGFRLEPHFFLLDANGTVLRQWVGYVSYSTLAQAIEEAINRP